MTSTKPPVVIEERSAKPAFTPRAGRWVRTLPFLGPAFVAAVAYVDPGNFATNSSGGASFGYRLPARWSWPASSAGVSPSSSVG